MMGNSIRIALTAGLVATGLDVSAGVPANDQIFKSEFMETFVIEGSAGYPTPLGNATVEAHFGDLVASARTGGDGSYRVGIEVNQIDPTAIVEIVARGSGGASAIAWASPLGPLARLVSLAGADNELGFADEPLVHLGPRSTALAGAIRAFNEWQPAKDAATFHRAARARQIGADDLMLGLAMIARGDLALPDGVPDTFAAVSSLAASQALWSAEQTALASCGFDPGASYCDVPSTYPLEPTAFPPVAWSDGVLHWPILAFGSVTQAPVAFRPTAGGAADVLIGGGAGVSVAATATALADGGYELAPAGGGNFGTFEYFAYVGGEQVQALQTTTGYYVRLTSGPGGQVEIGYSTSYEISYPDNPEIPTETIPYDPAVLPRPDGANALPVELLADVPTLTNTTVVMPSLVPQPFEAIDGGYAYDTHAFGSTDGVAERAGQAFTFVADGDSLTMDSAGRHAEVRFLNEEQPDIWRIALHINGTDGENLIEGVLLPSDADGFTAPAVPGSYRSRLNGFWCAGPYGDLQTPPANEGDYYPFCVPPYILSFHEDGTIEQDFDGDLFPWGDWSLPGGADSGRLLLTRPDLFDPSLVLQYRGWEAVHRTGNTLWVLENFTSDEDGTGAAPITFAPTKRLVPYELQ